MKKYVSAILLLCVACSALAAGRTNRAVRHSDNINGTRVTVGNDATGMGSSDFESVSVLYRNGKLSADSVINLGLQQKTLNPALAERYLKLVADHNNPRAMTELGTLYVFSPDFSSHLGEGLDLLDKASKAGYDKAFDYLGFYYFRNTDYPKALSYFDARQSSHEGFAYAALGSMYLEGKGVKEDGRKAKENFHQSALKGYSRGMALYANLLGTKNGGSLNYPDAFFWHYIAGDLGENYSRVMLYRPRLPEKAPQGEVAQDARTALQWIEAVHSGKSLKNEPIYKDGFLVGLQERERAAENGDDWSRYYLGSMNYNGDFFNQNYARAIRYYEPISNNAVLPAPLLVIVNERLAEMYRDGKGTKADRAKAALYTRRAEGLSQSNK